MTAHAIPKLMRPLITRTPYEILLNLISLLTHRAPATPFQNGLRNQERSSLPPGPATNASRGWRGLSIIIELVDSSFSAQRFAHHPKIKADILLGPDQEGVETAKKIGHVKG